jgi:hypothetical protein
MGKKSYGDIGKTKGEGRMGRDYVKADEGKREEHVVGDWAGVGQENVPDVADGNSFLKGQQGIRSSRRRLIDDVGPCTIKKFEGFSCQQQ